MTLKTLFSSLPTLPNPVSRFLRVVGAATLAVGMGALVKYATTGTLTLADLATVVTLMVTAAIVAADKYLRDAGVY
jgi:hypothetical protein